MITKWQKFSFAFLLALAYSDIAKVYFSIMKIDSKNTYYHKQLCRIKHDPILY